jgi:hypothetical protein
MVGVTGSIPVVPTILRNRKSRRRLAIGRFCGDFRRYRSPLPVSGDPCGLLSRFLAPSLCIQKFRSRRQGFDGQCRSAAGNFGSLGGQKRVVLSPARIYRLSRVQSESLELPAPFGWGITQAHASEIVMLT